MLFKPMLEAGLSYRSSVHSIPRGEVMKNFGADSAVELLRHWLGEGEVIDTIVSLGIDICYSHSDLEFSAVKLLTALKEYRDRIV